MKMKIFLIIILIFFLPVFPLYAEDSIKSLEKENIKTQSVIKKVDEKGQSLSLVDISSYIDFDVDLLTGALSLKETDFVLPGKNGFDFKLIRSYNSSLRESRANFVDSKDPIIIDFKEHKDYYKLSVFKEFPKISQWHGYMGGGWQFNFGGQLFIRKVWAGPGFKWGGQGMSQAYSPYQSMPSIAVAQISSNTYYFNGPDSQDNFINNKKGAYERLIKSLSGFTLYLKDGTKYNFDLNYFHLKDHQRMDTKFLKAENHNLDFYNYFLTSIEDIKNNKIIFNYDKGTTLIDKYYTVEDNWPDMAPVRRDLGEFRKKYRLLSISDSGERSIKFGYDGKSERISEIKVSNIEKEITYKYDYDENAYLTAFVQPDGRKRRYDYTELLQDSNKVNILTGVYLLTGGRINYSYVNLTSSESTQNYCVLQKKIIGSGSESVWSYNYLEESTYNFLKDLNPMGKLSYYKRVNVIDPLGNTFMNIYNEGLLLNSNAGEITVERNEWDFENRRVLKSYRRRGFRTENLVIDKYDNFGNPLIIKDLGDMLEQSDDIVIVTKYQHDLNKNYSDKNILNIICYRLVKEGEKVVSEKSFVYDNEGFGNLVLVSEIGRTNEKPRKQFYYYDSKNNLVAEGRVEGQKQKEYSYDPSGIFVTKVNYPELGLSQESSYDFITGIVTSISDFNQNKKNYEYDLSGRLIKLIRPDKSYVECIYNDGSNEIKIIEHSQNNDLSKIYSYNQLGLLNRITDPLGNSVKYKYDRLFRLSEGIDQENKITRINSDIFGNISLIEKPDKNTIRAEYDYFRNCKTVYDEKNRKTSYFYNPRGSLIKVVLPDQSYSQYQHFDSFSNIKSIRDFKGLETLYFYDSYGGLKEKFFSDGTKEMYQYDAIGDLNIFTDRNGVNTYYDDYDDLGRIHTVRLKNLFDAKEETVKYFYDQNNNGLGYLTNIKSPGVDTSYYYDISGRIESKKQVISAKTYNTDYKYDQFGNIVKVIEPVKRHLIEYEYNELNKVKRVKSILNGENIVIAELSYTPCGFIEEVKYPYEGVSILYEYDRIDRLIEIRSIKDDSQEIIFNHKYAYDSCGNRISLNYKVGFGEENIDSFLGNINYSYDLRDQLSKIMYSDGTNFIYNYDKNGNRTYFKHDFGDVRYFYDNVSDKLLNYRVDSRGYVDYEYDRNGNVIEIKRGSQLPKIKIQYDARNMMKKVIEGNDAVLFCDYDSLGQRIKKTEKDNAIIYHYDENRQVISESDGNGNARSIYINAMGQRLARIDFDSDNKERIYFYYNDILGTPAVITSDKCREQSISIVDPFGNTELVMGDGKNRYGFTGKEKDASTNYYYFDKRYYDPLLGRFLNVDPEEPDINDPQALNPYVYCKNNPIKFIDSEGERTYYINGIGNPGSGPTKEGKAMYKFFNITNPGLVKDFKILGGHVNGKFIGGIDWKGAVNTAKEMLNMYVYSKTLANYINNDLKAKPLTEGEQLNIIAYSGGGQIALNIAELLKGNVYFDNMVLIGSPVLQNNYDNFNKVYYIYGENDLITKYLNPSVIVNNNNGNIKYINAGRLNHFDYFNEDHFFDIMETVGGLLD